jgi:hypothetical protein
MTNNSRVNCSRLALRCVFDKKTMVVNLIEGKHIPEIIKGLKKEKRFRIVLALQPIESLED